MKKPQIFNDLRDLVPLLRTVLPVVGGNLVPAINRGTRINIRQSIKVAFDPDNDLAHLVITRSSDQAEQIVCGSEARQLMPVGEGEIPIPLLCPGCLLMAARALADHYNLRLDGPRGNL